MDKPDLVLIFNERLKERGLDVKKLSDLTGIAVRHLEHLRGGNFEELPPAPYLHGYLQRIGPIIGIDPDEWWAALTQSGLVRGSGAEDELPKNRFAREPVRKIVFGVIVMVIVIVYLALRLPAILGEPKLIVSYPPPQIVSVNEPSLAVRGTLTGGERVSVDGEPVQVSDRGEWETRITLQSGLNTIEIAAKKFLGREVRLERQVLYEPAQPPATLPQPNTSTPETGVQIR